MSTSSQTTKFDHGAPALYEVTWKSGHVEQVAAHQVIVPNELTRGSRITFHAEVDGRWTLVMYANDADIVSVRNLADGEQIPGGAR